MKSRIVRLSVLAVLAIAAVLHPAQAQTPPQEPLPATEPAIDTIGSSPSRTALVDAIIVKYRIPSLHQVLDVNATAAAVQAGGQSVEPVFRLTDAALAALSAQAGLSLTERRQMSGDTYVLELPEPMSFEQADRTAKQLTELAEVEYAEPDGRAYIALTPNDPRYSDQWHYFAPAANNYGANLPPAWDITTGSASIVVAVIDTGYRPHADLSGVFLQGYDFIGDTLVANDGNGRDTDASDPGDWITSAESASGYFADCQVRNSSWHGTHLAGTIGANADNALGVAGINWNAKIVPVRVLGKCFGYISDIVDGMRWSAGLSVPGAPSNLNPARVLNLSLGGVGACGSSYQTAIDQITAAGALVVTAAGNGTMNVVNTRPANCNNVATVAATNRTGSPAWYSNFGTLVEISAPGGDIRGGSTNGVLSTLNTGTTTPGADSYAWYQGTSMAAPHVAGIASLMLSISPTLSAAQLINLMQTTATSFPAGSTCTTSLCGSGIVNAGAAVEAAQGSANNASNTISGTVRASNGSPVAGALVSAIPDSPGQLPLTTLSNVNGTFAFRVVAGVYRIQADKAGIGSGQISNVVVPPDRTGINITLNATQQNAADMSIDMRVAPNPGTIFFPLTYTIAITNNGPATATGVQLTFPLHSGYTLVSASTTSGSCSGISSVNCAIGALANGATASVVIVVVPHYFGGFSSDATVTANEADPTTPNRAFLSHIINGPSAPNTISGTVRASNNSPVAGALVSAIPDSPGQLPLTTLSNVNGVYSFRVAAGTWTIQAGKAGLPSVQVSNVVVPPDRTGITITLGATPTPTPTPEPITYRAFLPLVFRSTATNSTGIIIPPWCHDPLICLPCPSPRICLPEDGMDPIGR